MYVYGGETPPNPPEVWVHETSILPRDGTGEPPWGWGVPPEVGGITVVSTAIVWHRGARRHSVECGTEVREDTP